MAAPGAPNPDHDRHTSSAPRGHGTWVLAGLLACAPDAEVHAVKVADLVAGVQVAMQRPGVRVLSVSKMTEDHRDGTPLTDREKALELAILTAISNGITVVAAAGNFCAHAFPAMMPDVCAVGGVKVDARDGLGLWPDSSHFVSLIYQKRCVPDLCAMASEVTFPIPDSRWDTFAGMTSAAAPQVAAVAALLLQKKPGLTPNDVRQALMDGAKPVRDAGTGAGLVDALASWRLV